MRNPPDSTELTTEVRLSRVNPVRRPGRRRRGAPSAAPRSRSFSSQSRARGWPGARSWSWIVGAGFTLAMSAPGARAPSLIGPSPRTGWKSSFLRPPLPRERPRPSPSLPPSHRFAGLPPCSIGAAPAPQDPRGTWAEVGGGSPYGVGLWGGQRSISRRAELSTARARSSRCCRLRFGSWLASAATYPTSSSSWFSSAMRATPSSRPVAR